MESMDDTDDDTPSSKNNNEPHEHTLSACHDPGTLRRLSFVPRLFRHDGAPPEATALALDSFGRGALIMSSIFLGPALLELAQNAVEQACRGDELCILDGRVYGFRPSSVLSNIAVASGLAGSLFMPVCGALVDHTPHRWKVGSYSAMGLVIVKAVEATVSSRTWWIVALLQVLSAVLYNLHVTTTLAYTSELSNDPQQQTVYNTYYTIVLYIANLVFLAVVLTTSTLLGLADVGTARVSQITTSSMAAATFGTAWTWFFRPRPALSRVPEGQTLWTVGFQKVGRTFGRIITELPALKWLQLAVMFGEGATTTITSIGTTFMKSFMLMDANEIAVVFLAVLVCGGPGSKLGGWVALKTDPITSAILCNTVYLASTTLAALYFTTPAEHKAYMPLLGMVWGLCMGWLFPMHATAVIHLIPDSGQQAEFMGIYILSGQLLSWMPPLVFTAINEAGWTMTWGLASMGIFYGIAIGCLIMVHVSTGDTKCSSKGGQYNVPPEAEELEALVAKIDNGSSQDGFVNTSVQQRKSVRSHTS